MPVKWFAKVEYKTDNIEKIVEESFVKDYDVAPVFDPLRTYRVFWSPIEGDTPQLMLKRVPEIPDLSEEDEKAGEPGYYRACILAVKDTVAAFDDSRTRKSTHRGRSSDSSSTKKSASSTHTKKKKDTSGSSEKAPLSKADTERVKHTATRNNLGSRSRNSVFKDLDKALRDRDSDDFDSDDSVNDVTLVSDNQIKVLNTSIKLLKQKLLEKCEENENLIRELKVRNKELDETRQLNRQLQQVLVRKLDSTPSSRPSSLSVSRNTSRSSSISSLSNFDIYSPPCARSRSDSTSSIASVPSTPHSKTIAQPPASPIVSVQATPKRKTPPTTPGGDGRKKSFKEALTSGPSNGNIATSSNDALSRQSSSEVLSPSRVNITPNLDSSTTTIVADNSSADLDESVEKERQQVESDQVEFCKDFWVDKSSLMQIESRALGKQNDGTYVKELATLVFGPKVLYNSSISERKYSRGEEENRKPRPKLNEVAIREIASRLAKRVFREFQGVPPPPEEQKRYKISYINRLIGDKIKKMRQNKNFNFLGSDLDSDRHQTMQNDVNDSANNTDEDSEIVNQNAQT